MVGFRCLLLKDGEPMKMTYDPTVAALTIRFVEERVECEVGLDPHLPGRIMPL
jgi:hypothetical protein